MKTIHDISQLDQWQGTVRCGFAGHKIQHILYHNNLESEFDIEDQWDEQGNILGHKFIIKGIAHNSQQEREAMELIFSQLNPQYLPVLWEDPDFCRIDRDCAEKELHSAYKKIDEYNRLIAENRADEAIRLIRKHYYFGFITCIRGIAVGITPERFYKIPAGEYVSDAQGGSQMVSPLPAGKYTVFHILDGDNIDPVCENEIWASSDADLFNHIDKMRGK